jgi:hypothetical protein
MAKKTHEQYCQELKDIYNDEYILLTKYEGVSKKVLVKHNISSCEHEWEVNPRSLLQLSGCPKCAMQVRIKKLSKTNEQFYKELFDKVGDSYIVLDEYNKDNIKIRFKHNIAECGKIFEMTPNNFLHGQRCLCETKNNKKPTYEEFTNKINSIYNGEIIVLGDYINAKIRLTVQHKCGYMWDAIPDTLLRNCGCPICNENIITTDIFKQRVNELSTEYVVLGMYINTHTKIEFLHLACNHKFKMSPSNFLSGQSCPYCRFSRGEKTIENYLIENSHIYKSQYRIHDCKYKKPLPFDFAIFNNDGSLHSLIEYDGEQHYKTTRFQNSLNKLELIRVRDNIKNEYCINNNIKLIRIPYWKLNNIDSILEKELIEGA